MKKFGIIVVALVLELASGMTKAQTTTYNGPTTTSDTWNNPVNWDNGLPSGTTNAVIAASKQATADSSSTPVYSGSLTLLNNSTLMVGWLGSFAQDTNALGTIGSTIIYMNSGSLLYLRTPTPATITVPAIQLMGNAQVRLSDSTQGGSARIFNPITGPYTLTLDCGNGKTGNLNYSNSFSAFIGSGVAWTLNANASGSLGDGSVTLNGPRLTINAVNVISDTATLSLNGTSTPLTMNANDTIYSLFINGTQQVRGVYTSTGMGNGWMTGSGSLTVSVGAPTQPTGLKAAMGSTSKSVRLDWPSVTDATGYNIKRSLTNSGYVKIGSATGTNYTDFTVNFINNYYYVVSATNSYVESANSAAVMIALPVPGTVITIR